MSLTKYLYVFYAIKDFTDIAIGKSGTNRFRDGPCGLGEPVLIQNTSGEIFSPNNSSGHSDDLDCSWKLQVSN